MDAWDALPTELVAALFEVTYPLRERDARQFRALAAWRQVGARYRRIVERDVFGAMQRLPRTFHGIANDATLRFFPQLRAFKLPANSEGNNEGEVDWCVTSLGLATLTRLQSLVIPPGFDYTDEAAQSITGNIGARVDAMIANAPRSLTALDLHWDEYYRNRAAVYNAPLSPLGHLDSLTQLSLHGVLDVASLEGLTRVTRLTVSYAEFDVLPNSFASSLTALTLKETNGSFDVETLARLTALRELNIDVGELEEEPAHEAVMRLTALERLAVRSYGVSDLTLAPLQRLTALDTSYTHVTDVTLHTLADQLLELKLGPGNALSGAGLASLRRLQKLKLRGDGGQMGTGVIHALAPLAHSLTSLDMRGGHHPIPGAELRQLTRLTELDVIDCKDIVVDDLAPLVALRRLSVDHTHFSLGELAVLTRLETLVLRGHMFPPDGLDRLTTLTELDLGRNPVFLPDLAHLSRLRRLRIAASLIPYVTMPATCYVTATRALR